MFTQTLWELGACTFRFLSSRFVSNSTVSEIPSPFSPFSLFIDSPPLSFSPPTTPHSSINMHQRADQLSDKSIQCISLDDVIKLGKESPVKPQPPKPDDLAVIMYTSGTTCLFFYNQPKKGKNGHNIFQSLKLSFFPTFNFVNFFWGASSNTQHRYH